MDYYFERYQYIIKMNGVVVRTSDSFDAPYGAVTDFLDFAKEHYPAETFERTGLLDGGVCLVNKQPTHTRCGVTTTVRFEIRFYKMVAEPMTCQGFVDNILRVEAEKKARKAESINDGRDEGHLGDILDTASWNNFN